MRDNLLATKGFVQAEHVMLALAPKLLGKQSAHVLVYRVAMEAAERGTTLREALLAEPQIVSRVSSMWDRARVANHLLSHGQASCLERIAHAYRPFQN